MEKRPLDFDLSAANMLRMRERATNARLQAERMAGDDDAYELLARHATACAALVRHVGKLSGTRQVIRGRRRK